MKLGVFLGHRRSANSYIVMDEKGGVATSRALQMRPAPEQWQPDEVRKLRVMPWEQLGRLEVKLICVMIVLYQSLGGTRSIASATWCATRR